MRKWIIIKAMLLLLSSCFTTLNISTITTINAFVVVPTPLHRIMDSKQVEMKKQVHDVSFYSFNVKTYKFRRLYESNDDPSSKVTSESSLSSSSSSSSTMTTNENMNYSPNNDAQQQNQENNDDNDVDENDDTLNQIILHKFETYYPTSATKPPQQLLTFCLQEYKPLGLTAEESLARKDVTSGSYHHVFVSKIIPNGNADKAGIQVGDVIVGISGLFGSTECVVGESLEKVKGMIASQRDDTTASRKGLMIKVIRGSLVMSDHESALVDLCTLPENELKVDQCIETLYKHEYDLKIATNDSNNDGMVATQPCNDAETECMLDALFSSWGDEIDLDSNTENDNARQEESQTQKPAPWSSRSSPSGTFVRDPKTGKLINIDA